MFNSFTITIPEPPAPPVPAGDGLKNLLGFGAAAGLIGAFTTQKGIDRRAKKAEARYEKRLIKKGLPIPVQKSAREITEEYMKKNKFGGGVKKK